MPKWIRLAAIGTGVLLTGACLGELQVPIIPPTTDLNLRSVSVGAFHACAVDASGDIYCWGANSSGQLGDESATNKSAPSEVLGEDLIFSSVDAGGLHTCAITATREAFCWGENANGQLGTGQITPPALAPTSVSTTESIVRISAGNGHSCAVTEDGVALCWGSQSAGQLGIGSSGPDPRSSPQPVVGGLMFRTISAGAEHTCGVTTDGEGYCWGANESDQLGTGLPGGAEVPTPVAGDLVFDEISAGVAHSCGVTVDLEVYCWGEGASGQLGTGNLSSSDTPVQTPFEFNEVVESGSVSAGGAYSCAVIGESTRCWGINDTGQLGDGTSNLSPSPVDLSTGVLFTDISASLAPFSGFTCAITVDEIVYCWGSGTNGQLGNGSTSNRFGPVPVSGQN